MTEKLYHADASLQQFEARVLESRPLPDGGCEVRLDRTAFYATAGGQPHDTGRLGDARVLDVRDEDGALWHRLDRAVTGDVSGRLDWERRLDHTQQHTGQHILSQAFIETCRAETVSFHLGLERVTIDLNRDGLTDAEVSAAEDLANAIIQEDRPVRIHWTTSAEVHRFPLRKPPKVSGDIRVVEVADFDFSACGGTHVDRTGRLGLIKVLGRERYKGGLRVEFLCGRRALADYGWKHVALQSLAGRFSTQDRDVDAAVSRLEQDVKELRRRLKELEERRLDQEAVELAAAAPAVGALRLVRLARPVETPDELKGLAGRLRAQAGLAVLLGGVTPDGRAHLVFARADDLAVDMNGLLRGVLPLVDGKGGGRPEMAQGSGPGAARLDDALDAAARGLEPAGEDNR